MIIHSPHYFFVSLILSSPAHEQHHVRPGRPQEARARQGGEARGEGPHRRCVSPASPGPALISKPQQVLFRGSNPGRGPQEVHPPGHRGEEGSRPGHRVSHPTCAVTHARGDKLVADAVAPLWNKSKNGVKVSKGASGSVLTRSHQALHSPPPSPSTTSSPTSLRFRLIPRSSSRTATWSRSCSGSNSTATP